MKKIMGILLLFGLIATHESEGQSRTQVQIGHTTRALSTITCFALLAGDRRILAQNMN